MVYVVVRNPPPTIRVWDRINHKFTSVTVVEWERAQATQLITIEGRQFLVSVPVYGVFRPDIGICTSNRAEIDQSGQYFDFATASIASGDCAHHLHDKWVGIDRQPDASTQYLEPRFAKILTSDDLISHFVSMFGVATPTSHTYS